MPLRIVFMFALALMLGGCAGLRPLKPGNASMQSGMGTNGLPEFRSELRQPENPAREAAQNFERVSETELPLAAGTRIIERTVGHDESGQTVHRERTIVLAQATMQRTRISEKAGTVIGAAQKDMARELGAKLGSLRAVVWVGLALVVFGLASLVWAPLRAVVGSVTTSLALVVGGLALIVLPSLVVGNELLILGGVALAVGAWFLAHRHGHLRGLVDANRNGIDDRMEGSGTRQMT